MIETLEKIFEFNKTIENKTSIIIDAFSAFYGNENRNLIEAKFRNVPISIKFEEDVIKKIILELKSEELCNYIENNIESKELKNKFTKYLISKSFEDNRLSIIEFENLKYSADIDNEKISNEYQKIKREFNTIKGKYKEINELIRIYNCTREELNLKYRTEYQNKVRDLLLNHTKLPVNTIINNLDLFAEKDFNDIPLVHLVHEKDNNKIIGIFENDALFPTEMVIQGINNLKKEYFDKLSGKDLELEAYYTNPEYKQYILEDKILKNLELIRNKMIVKYNKAFIDVFSFLTNKNEVTEDFYKEYNYSRTSQTNWKPYKKNKETLLELFTIIYFNDLKSLKNLDATIIHELNHILELKINKQEEDYVEFSVGWDTFKYIFDTKEMIDLNKEKYRYINEGINEIISLDILSKLRNKDYIFNDMENCLERNSMYNRYEFLLRDFYEEYKDTIIQSRLSGDISIIMDKVGKDNFNDLNNLVNDFNKYFSTSKPLKTFENKRNIILDKMRQRSNTK